MSEKRFSLKDHLFNPEKVEAFSAELAAAWPDFPREVFVAQVVDKLPELELMQRVYWIRDCLYKFLPAEYEVALAIILKSLPPACDPAFTDDDFGDFIYAPYGYFVAEYGCTKDRLAVSLAALRELTTRFSVEGPIRYFLNAFPAETLSALEQWVTDEHYHVRRLVSEGTRPKLPWAKAVSLPYQTPLTLLDQLHADPTRFVTRSVANHLNDIAKLDPRLVVQTLRRWHKARRQAERELAFMTKHALRTLVKNGDQAALALLGYAGKEIRVTKFMVLTPQVRVGQALEFSFEIVSIGKKPQPLMIDYQLYFVKANGDLAAKTHKICQHTLAPAAVYGVTKKHPLRVMTTRKLYPGQHRVELQINGQKYNSGTFQLLV